MAVDFKNFFWGEKNNGFDILYHNMKYGCAASKELADFFRERSVVEETHSKLILKISNKAGSGCAEGTFSPFWDVLKTSSEKLSALHTQMVQGFQDLLREVQKYCEDQQKRHKKVKEEESGTLEAVQSIQQTAATLHKAKEIYNARCLEHEKLKRENGSAKEIEKADLKSRKASEEYKAYVKKYSTIRNEFENKMAVSCEHFQRIEEDHLKQMKMFLFTYAKVLKNGHALIGQVYDEFRQLCDDMDIEKLLNIFTKSRGTGPEKPGPIVFEEADLSGLNPLNVSQPAELANGGEKGPIKKEGKKLLSLRQKSKPSRRTTSLMDLFFSSSSNADKDGVTTSPEPTSTSANISPSNSDPLSRTTFRASKWFLKSKRDKRKKKKKVNGNKDDAGSSDKETARSKEQTLVDEEGFMIRPSSQSKENDKDSFYSSSEGESDDDEKERKIHIQIKPLNNGTPMSASVDELRATIGTLSLSPVSQHSNRRIYSSATSTPEDGPGKSKTDADVLSIFSPSASSASTPTGGMQSPVVIDATPNSTNRYAGLNEIFAEISQNDSSNAELAKINSNNGSRVGTPTASISAPLLPRPPSRRNVEHNSRGRMSPLPGVMTRTESVGSLTSDFKTTSMSVGSSRGPSPLTIGMCDPIPLAVAFQEVVHAYFRGTDETKCQVRLMGDMKVSFPAGIVQVLANNPSPATLSFRVTRTGRLENVLPNKHLISQDLNLSAGDHYVYEFNMPALTALLRKQYEQTPTASYFNIDILKYHIKHQPGAKSTPLHLVAYWKCEDSTTDLKIDFKYNPGALATMAPITNISIVVPVDGGVTNVQSMPAVQWNSENQRATWWVSELSHHSDGGGLGSLRARFELGSGPSNPSTLAAQFSCMGTSLSGADFELLGLGYRLSLVKKQVVAGKYLCEGDSASSSV